MLATSPISSLTHTQSQLKTLQTSSKGTSSLNDLPKSVISKISQRITSINVTQNTKPLPKNDALQQIDVIENQTKERLGHNASNPQTAERLQSRLKDIQAIRAAIKKGDIELIGFAGWGNQAAYKVPARQGISEYDTLVFKKNGRIYAEQIGSSWLRSKLNPPQPHPTNSRQVNKQVPLTATGAVYAPTDNWQRVDQGRDTHSLLVSVGNQLRSYQNTGSLPYDNDSDGESEISGYGETKSNFGHNDIDNQSDLESEFDASLVLDKNQTQMDLPRYPEVLPPLKDEIIEKISLLNPKLGKAIRAGNHEEVLKILRQESQRSHTLLNGPFGLNPTVYADLNAYGTPLEISAEVSRLLSRVSGNTHGDSAYAQANTHYVTESAREIAAHFGAPLYKPDTNAPENSYDILVRGAGFTSASAEYFGYLRRYIEAVLLKDNTQKLEEGAIAVTIYEHHSNSLPFQTWNDKAEQLPLNKEGVLDLGALEGFLTGAANAQAPFILLSLSMQSNVTSVKTDILGIRDTIVSFLTRYPQYQNTLFLSLDLAAYAPHATLDLQKLTRDAQGTPLVDAIAFSPYKVDGGQQGSGVALVRAHITGDTPLTLGGGTVTHVYEPSTKGTYYAWKDRYDLHNAGSPNSIGLVNTYLGLYFQEQIGFRLLEETEKTYTATAYKALHLYRTPTAKLEILGPKDLSLRGNTFPFVLSVKHKGQWLRLPPAWVGLILEHTTGVVTRSGCNCAGPYAYELFEDLRGDVAVTQAEYLKDAPPKRLWVRAGWVRGSVSHLWTQEELEHFIWSWQWVTKNIHTLLSLYTLNDAEKLVPKQTTQPIPMPVSFTYGIHHLGGRMISFPQHAPNIISHRKQALENHIKTLSKTKNTKVLDEKVLDELEKAWQNWETYKEGK